MTQSTTIDPSLERFLLSIADDDFLVGQRLIFWLATSPTLEEDNVLTSIAQDELGHARLFYDVIAEARDTTVDELAIWRPADERRNSILIERQQGDFADTVTRNYLYDVAEKLLLESIANGGRDSLRGQAEVALDEEPYHLEHAERWLNILMSTAEARERMKSALRRNLAAARDYYAFEDEVEAALLGGDVIADPFADLAAEWRETVASRIAELPLDFTEAEVLKLVDGPPERNGRRGEHTDDLAVLLDSIEPDEISRI